MTSPAVFHFFSWTSGNPILSCVLMLLSQPSGKCLKCLLFDDVISSADVVSVFELSLSEIPHVPSPFSKRSVVILNTEINVTNTIFEYTCTVSATNAVNAVYTYYWITNIKFISYFITFPILIVSI